jgi:Predicted membrane protein
MTILVILVVILITCVWDLYSKVSKLEAQIKDLKKVKAEKQTGNEPEKTKAAAISIPDETVAAKVQIPSPVDDILAYDVAVAKNKPASPVVKMTVDVFDEDSSLEKAESGFVNIPNESKLKTEEKEQVKSVNWELFTGIKLFAWIGGFAAFLGMVFFTKYAFENILTSILIRVGICFAAGIVLLCTGILTKSEKLKTTGNVLSAIGIVFIYITAFAAGNIYHFLSPFMTFSIMVAASIIAFIVSVHKNAKYISVLAIAGGYLTPFLLSSGSGAVLELSLYIAVITAVAMAISLRKKWSFLINLSAIGVALILAALYMNGFVVLKTLEMAVIFIGYGILFTVFAVIASKKYKLNGTQAYLQTPFLFNTFLMLFSVSFFRESSYMALGFLGVINTFQLLIAANDSSIKKVYFSSSAISFIILFLWTALYLSQASLWQALAAYFIFFLLNAAIPLFDSYKNNEKPFYEYSFFPAALPFVMAICLMKVGAVSFSFWIVLMIAALFALAVSEITKNLFTGFLSVCGIFSVIIAWFLYSEAFFIGVNFAILPCGIAFGVFVLAVIMKKAGGSSVSEFTENGQQPMYSIYNMFFISVFILLSLAMIRLKPEMPGIYIISGLVITLFIIILSLLNKSKEFTGILAALFSMFFIQFLWQTLFYQPGIFTIISIWYLAVFAFFFAIVFLLQKQFAHSKLPWFIAALAGVLQCFLIYLAARNEQLLDYVGFIPAFFAVIYGLAVLYLLKSADMENEFHKSRIGIFTATALFFITMIFPMQFKIQWFIAAWSLEALALVSLFGLISYKPLKYWAFWIFAIVFLLLAIPSASMFSVSAGSIMNGYLYLYLIAIISMITGAFFWTPKDEKYCDINNRNTIFTMGTILLFILMNIEIAAFFSTGGTIQFKLNNSLAQEMSYTLGWGLFSIGLFVFGIIKKVKACRICGLVLLSVATFKLFLYDLWSLGQLYRIGSLFGLAAMLILVSFLYQKYVIRENEQKDKI